MLNNKRTNENEKQENISIWAYIHDVTKFTNIFYFKTENFI